MILDQPMIQKQGAVPARYHPNEDNQFSTWNFAIPSTHDHLLVSALMLGMDYK